MLGAVQHMCSDLDLAVRLQCMATWLGQVLAVCVVDNYLTSPC